MGAEVPYLVTVYRLVTDTVEVSAVTSEEAMQKAAREHGVAQAVCAWPKCYGPIGSNP